MKPLDAKTLDTINNMTDDEIRAQIKFEKTLRPVDVEAVTALRDALRERAE